MYDGKKNNENRDAENVYLPYDLEPRLCDAGEFPESLQNSSISFSCANQAETRHGFSAKVTCTFESVLAQTPHVSPKFDTL